MPIVLSIAPEFPLPLNPPRKRWTREQCASLEVAGFFERERLELVDGELISRMGKNRPHVNAFTLMLFWLMEAFGKQFVNAEAPIDVSPEDNPANEPEPDLIVLNREFTAFAACNPQPHDISLLVEIADSTLSFDLTTKAALYARAGIVEYWVLDVAGKRSSAIAIRSRAATPRSPSTTNMSRSDHWPLQPPNFDPRKPSSHRHPHRLSI